IWKSRRRNKGWWSWLRVVYVFALLQRAQNVNQSLLRKRSARRKARLRRAVDVGRGVRLQAGNLRQHAGHSSSTVVNLQAPAALPPSARRQQFHPSLLPLETPEIRIIRGRLQAGDIAVFQRPRVLPDGKTGQLLAVPAHDQPAIGRP